jgi:hypothetical protein
MSIGRKRSVVCSRIYLKDNKLDILHSHPATRWMGREADFHKPPPNSYLKLIKNDGLATRHYTRLFDLSVQPTSLHVTDANAHALRLAHRNWSLEW